MATFNVEAFTVPRALPVSLGFVAGFIDACTFSALFRLFVAQVTGGFVITGAQFVDANPSMMVPVIAIPVLFLIGMVTALVLALSGRTGWAALTIALAMETALIVGFFLLGTIGAPFERVNAPLAVAASLLAISAMSVQSTLVRLLMADTPSTNVMTTNTTQLAIDAAEWLIASHQQKTSLGNSNAQAECMAARRRFTGLISIMTTFLGGTVCGALSCRWFGLSCLLAAVVILAIMVGYSASRSRFVNP
jgi:uncharacterized membrane protein YoaK (UPF0700 family)